MGKRKAVVRPAPWAAALVFLGASLLGCGQDLEHRSRPGDIPVGDGTLSLAASKTAVRADGDDRLELTATVRGLTSVVRFEIIDGPGNLQAEPPASIGAGSFTDGAVVDVQADRLGVARVNYRSDFAGKAVVAARSLHAKAEVEVDAKFATLIIAPGQVGAIASGASPVQNLTSVTGTVSVVPGGQIALTAIGGVPPYNWFSSNPNLIGVSVASENSVIAFVHGHVTATSGSVIVSVLDAEGNFAAVTVEINSSVFFDPLVVTPSTLSFSGTSSLDTGPIPITITGGAPPYAVTILSPFGFSGVSTSSSVTPGNTSISVTTKDPTTKQFQFFYRVLMGVGSITEDITVIDSLGSKGTTSVTATVS